MCQFCKLKHEEATCSVKASLYCSSCACYGHTIRECPDPIDELYTKPLFSKRIILPSFKESKPILEIRNEEESLKAFLQSKSKMPARSVKTADLRKLVTLYADEKGYELSLVH